MWLSNSKRWKEFPKRNKSLTFLKNDKPVFGWYNYQVIPFKGNKIAYSSNGDFNNSFINKHLENIFTNVYYIGINDSYGKGYQPNKIITYL